MSGLTRSEAVLALHVTYPSINFFLNEGLLKSKRAMNPKSRQFINSIPQGSINQFLSKYDTLGLMSKRYRRAAGPFGCHLEAKGICPLEVPKGISWIYVKAGLAAQLHKIGLEIPQDIKRQ